jgi:hypothetical protein
MFGEQSAKERAKELTHQFTADPVLPMLGWTKAVESVVTGGPVLTWCLYAVIVTCAWIYADDLQRQASQAVDNVTDEGQQSLQEYQG